MDELTELAPGCYLFPEPASSGPHGDYPVGGTCDVIFTTNPEAVTVERVVRDAATGGETGRQEAALREDLRDGDSPGMAVFPWERGSLPNCELPLLPDGRHGDHGLRTRQQGGSPDMKKRFFTIALILLFALPPLLCACGQKTFPAAGGAAGLSGTRWDMTPQELIQALDLEEGTYEAKETPYGASAQDAEGYGLLCH